MSNPVSKITRELIEEGHYSSKDYMDELEKYIVELTALLRQIHYHTWRGVDVVAYTYAIPAELIDQIKPIIDETTDV